MEVGAMLSVWVAFRSVAVIDSGLSSHRARMSMVIGDVVTPLLRRVPLSSLVAHWAPITELNAWSIHTCG